MNPAAGVGNGKIRDFAFMAALCSHGLAWSAFVLLIFVPFYQGESITATPGGTNPTQPVESTATLIAVNGWGVVPIVLAPVAISGVGLLGLTLAVSGSLQRRITLGFSALLLLEARLKSPAVTR